jgi:uncharacterized membrane protein
MSQFNTPIRRSGGSLDVYTGLSFVAMLVLLAGVVLMALRNIEHSKTPNESGGVLKIID